MGKLSEIDEIIGNQLIELEKIFKKQKFKVYSEFRLTKDLDLSIFNGLKGKGIYFFEIHTGKRKIKLDVWKSDFTTNWDVRRLKHKHVSTSKVKRLKQHTEVKEWMPLYIGKSATLQSRVKEHFTLKKEKTTFALKLFLRNEMHGRLFRLSYISLDVKNYLTIAPFVENFLRQKHNPIVGKQ